MTDSRLAWFAMGASFGAVLLGWPWHPRFSRYSRRGSNPPPSPDLKPPPPAAPPYSSAAIAWRDAEIQRDANDAARAKHAAKLYAKFIDPSMGEPWIAYTSEQEEGRTTSLPPEP